MSLQTSPITINGKNKLELELDHLIKVEREALKKEIGEARELGDLKENAEYHAAKERQSHIEGRIAELQAIVAQAEVIDVKAIKSEKIVFGATINLRDIQKDQLFTYQIVGKDEADIKEGKISFLSPLGKALIGKEVGDTVEVHAPKGIIEYEVESFEYR
jgi:transcription elongation factor GreA